MAFSFFYKWILALNVYAYLSQSTYGSQETRKQPLEGGNLKKVLWRNMRQMKIKGIEDWIH